MALLDSIISTSVPSPPTMIVYGPPGVGKTTFAASANAILIDCEKGAGAVQNLKRTPYLETWPKMREWLVELAMNAPTEVTAIAIDTIDWMIQRIIEYVVHDLDSTDEADAKKNAKKDNLTSILSTAHGGYSKAREIVQNIVYRDLFPMLNAITDKGVAVILLAHATNTKMTTPEGYDLRLAAPDLPQWIAPAFIEWTDAVLYAHRRDDQRILLTEATNIILAKNRYSLPAELPLSWDALLQAISNNTNNKEQNNG